MNMDLINVTLTLLRQDNTSYNYKILLQSELDQI